MKIQTHSTARRQQGGSLLVTLFLTSLMFVTVAGYLMTARHQQQMGHRAQVWNLSMAVTEAGIEDALAHLNANGTSLAVSGWTREGEVYTRAQSLSSDARYLVTINMSDPMNPEILSRGFFELPVFAQNAPPVAPMLATIGFNANNSDSSSARHTVTRTVRVTTTRNNGLFLGSLIARDSVTMNGNNVRTDSFNSADPNHSDNGKFPANDPGKLLSGGDVYVNSSINNAANIGNANIYGRLVVGPGGVPRLGPNGGVGTIQWQKNNKGIQPGYFRDDSNFSFPDVGLPYVAGLTPQSGTIYVTNVTINTETINSTTFPHPPPTGGVVTNISYATSSVKPNPEPYGTVMNTITIGAKTRDYPAPGTFVGEVKKQGAWYLYNKISGYTWTYPVLSYTYSTQTTNYHLSSPKSYDYILRGGDPTFAPVNYAVDKINGKVFVTGNARLIAPNGFNGEITIHSDGKLEMWAGGNSISLAGNGVINENGYAGNCMIWCLPSVKNIAFSGNAQVTAVLYAPNASLQLNGGGNNTIDIIGSMVVKSATLNGHFNFHYDEALRSINSNARYLITSWNEL